jgi:threonine dehydrogenase-like Zn-dependent dehydrogenase
VQTALLATRTGGRCVWVGNSARMVELDMQDVVTREKTIQGVYCYDDADFARAVSFVVRNRKTVSEFVDETVSLEGAPKLFTQLARGEKEGMRSVVVFPYD